MSGRRRGRSLRTPRKCTRRCSGWATSTAEEGRPWQAWLDELAAARRVALEGGRWFAAEAPRDPKAVLRGRMEALGPVVAGGPDETLLRELEAEGAVLRTRIAGREAWCNRRLLARIHRYTLDRLRKEIEPVTASQFLRFLACWQHADAEHRLDGPRGVAQIVAQLAGFEIPAAAWEGSVLPVARARLQARMAGPAHALGRDRLGPALGRGRGADAAHADLPRRTPRPGRVVRARGADPRSRALRKGARGPGGAPPEGRDVLPGARARDEAAADVRGGRPERADRARTRHVRLVQRPALADRPRLETEDGRPLDRPMEPAAARSVEPTVGRVRGAPPPSAHRRRLPQDARPREAAASFPRRRARPAHARSARRGARRTLRRRVRRRAVRAARKRSSCCAPFESA